MILEMIKKYGLLYTLKYFRIIQFSIAAALIFLFQEPVFLLLCLLQGINNKTPVFYDLEHQIYPFFLAGSWMFFFYHSCRNQIYAFKTGRNHDYDRRHYHRSTDDLVDYFKDSEPHKLDTLIFPELHWKSADGIIFGRDKSRLISIPSDTEGNIAVFGPPGSGKTSGIAIMSAMDFSGSVLAIDIKGDLYNYVSKNSNRKILRFAPDHPDALNISCSFDPLEKFKKMDATDQKLFLKNMATILVPDEGGETGSYFSTRARKMFQGITYLLLYQKPQTTFPDIIHEILKGNIFDWVNGALKSNCKQAQEFLCSFYRNNEKNITSAYDTLTNALIDYSNPTLDKLLAPAENTISAATLDRGYDIYLQIKQEHLEAYAPLFTLLLQSFSTEFTNRPDSSTGVKNRPILMLMDEFPALAFSYSMINTNLSTLRSRSVICMIIQQNMSQLEYRYRNEGARAIIGNCNFQIILGSNDIHSSRNFSETFGYKKTLSVSNSYNGSNKISTGKNVTERNELVFPPEVFGDLGNDAILYFKGKYAKIRKLNCYRD